MDSGAAVKTRAVFFDAGHTLVYAEPSIEQVYVEEAARGGAIVPLERFKALFKPLFNEFFRDYSARPENAQSSDLVDYRMWRTMTREMYKRIPEMAPVAFGPWFDALYDRFGRAASWRIYDDAEPAIRALRARGLRLGIISNWDTRLRSIVRDLGLEAKMDFVLISAEVGWRKPHRSIFEEALKRAGVTPGEALHVGDLYDEDIVGAHAAGLRAVYLDRRGTAAPSDGVPHARIESLNELVEFVER